MMSSAYVFDRSNGDLAVTITVKAKNEPDHEIKHVHELLLSKDSDGWRMLMSAFRSLLLNEQ